MLCEKCHKREATIHICSFMDGVKQTRDICNDCVDSCATPEEAAFVASVRGAYCDFCGAPANMGGTDHFAPLIGDQHLIHYCFGCSKEYNRYTSSAIGRMPKNLSREQEIDALRKLRQDARKHMKDWLSRKPQ
jgi:protein-arginine kinase activator protein McsA